MLASSLAHIPGAEGCKAYDCSNSMEMYSLLGPEPCPDVAMNHCQLKTAISEFPTLLPASYSQSQYKQQAILCSLPAISELFSTCSKSI